MKKIIIILTFLSIMIANAITFQVGNNANAININLSALLNARADSESGTCYECISDSWVELGCVCESGDPESQEYWFYYFIDCWESAGGNEDTDRSCERDGYKNCAGETYYTINTCD